MRDDDGSNIKGIEMAKHCKLDDIMTDFLEWIASSQYHSWKELMPKDVQPKCSEKM